MITGIHIWQHSAHFEIKLREGVTITVKFTEHEAAMFRELAMSIYNEQQSALVEAVKNPTALPAPSGD